MSGTIQVTIRRTLLICLAGAALLSPLVISSGAEAAKPKKSLGTLKVKIVGVPAGTPVKIRVSGPRKTVRKIRRAGSRTLRRIPLGRYVVRASTTRFGGQKASPKKASRSVKLTKKSPKRSLKIRYRKTGATQPLRFKISKAEGLGIRASGSFGSSRNRSGVSARSAGDSDLAALLPSGELVDAVASSTSPIKVDYVLVRANAVYVVFRQPISLETGQPKGNLPDGSPVCIFAKIEITTEQISCVDRSLSKIGGQLSWIGWLAPPPVQFGTDGSIYYSGQIAGQSLPVLRRKAPSGQVTTVLSRPGLDNFVLLPSGRIAVRTCPGGNCGAPEHLIWSPGSGAGRFLTIPSLGILWYMVRFADGNLYFGNSNLSPYFLGIRSYDPIAEEFNPRSWVMAPWLPMGSGDSLFNPRQNTLASCVKPDPDNEGFLRPIFNRPPLCDGGGFQASSHIRSGGKDYLMIKTPPNWDRSPSSIVIEAYPNVRPIEFQELETVEFMTIVGSQMVASGLNAGGKHVTARVNLNDGDDKAVLLGATQEVKVLGLNADQTNNEVIFYGLDKSANRFVLGRVNLETGEVSKSQVDDPSFRLSQESFQSFG